MKKHNYVYVTTNLINRKQYVGDHSTDNLNDGYLGSGKALKLAIKKYGSENFERIILEEFKTKEKAFAMQERYINEYNTLTPVGYNICPKGGTRITDEHTEKSKIKISVSGKNRIPWNKGLKMTEEFKKKCSYSHMGQIPWNKGKTLSEEHKHNLRKPKSEEHKQNLRKPKSENGRLNIKAAHNTQEYKEKMSKILIGRIFTPKTIEKMSLAAKRRKKPSEKSRLKMSIAQKKRYKKKLVF